LYYIDNRKLNCSETVLTLNYTISNSLYSNIITCARISESIATFNIVSCGSITVSNVSFSTTTTTRCGIFAISIKIVENVYISGILDVISSIVINNSLFARDIQ
jgi:hypothetical protein